MLRKINNTIEFCIRVLRDNDISPEEYTHLVKTLPDSDEEYILVKREPTLYIQIAKALIKLWPSGMKDGKWPWRDSVDNIAARLETLWAARQLQGKTLEDCLMVARRYLARYENDTRYMMLLKYFIFKQDKILGPTGKYKNTYKSMLADMLEGKDAEDSAMNEWDALLAAEQFGEGELVC